MSETMINKIKICKITKEQSGMLRDTYRGVSKLREIMLGGSSCTEPKIDEPKCLAEELTAQLALTAEINEIVGEMLRAMSV